MADSLSPYRLTIIGAIAVLVLSVGLVTLLGGVANATAYLTLVGTVAIPGLFALARTERTATVVREQHAQNTMAIADNSAQIAQLAEVLKTK